MYATHPKMAKKWSKHTPDQKSLPEHVKKASDESKAFFTSIAKKIAGRLNA